MRQPGHMAQNWSRAMARYQPKEEQASDAQPQPERKIGYVARRLDDQQTAPATKTDAKPDPYMITDWASF